MHLLKAAKDSTGPSEVLLLQDTFTEAAQTNLELHVPDVQLFGGGGNGWTTYSGVTWSVNDVSDQLMVTASPANLGAVGIAVGRSTVRIETTMNFHRSGANTRWPGLSLWGSNTGWLGNHLHWRASGSNPAGAVKLFKSIDQVSVEIHEWTLAQSISDGTTHDVVCTVDSDTGIITVNIDDGATLDDSFTLSAADLAVFENGIQFGPYAQNPNLNEDLYDIFEIYGSSVADGPESSVWVEGTLWQHDAMSPSDGTNLSSHDGADMVVDASFNHTNVYTLRDDTNQVDSNTSWAYVEAARANNSQKMGTVYDADAFLPRHLTISTIKAQLTWAAANDDTYGGILFRHGNERNNNSYSDYPHLFFVPTGTLPTNTWTLYKQTATDTYTALKTFTSTYTVTDNITATPCDVEIRDHNNGSFEFYVDSEYIGYHTVSASDWTDIKGKDSVGLGCRPTTSPRGLQRLHDLKMYTAWLPEGTPSPEVEMVHFESNVANVADTGSIVIPVANFTDIQVGDVFLSTSRKDRNNATITVDSQWDVSVIPDQTMNSDNRNYRQRADLFVVTSGNIGSLTDFTFGHTETGTTKRMPVSVTQFRNVDTANPVSAVQPTADAAARILNNVELNNPQHAGFTLAQGEYAQLTWYVSGGSTGGPTWGTPRTSPGVDLGWETGSNQGISLWAGQAGEVGRTFGPYTLNVTEPGNTRSLWGFYIIMRPG